MNQALNEPENVFLSNNWLPYIVNGLPSACEVSDRCICLSAECHLINALTATINKPAEELLSLIEDSS